MMCCPLDGGGDPATVLDTSHPRAARDHSCTECRGTIHKGSKHELVKAMWDKRWHAMRTCMLCVEVREHFACGNGYIWGEVWNQLEENFFPDMKCGGPCMDGLSPAAKQWLIDKRMEWYFDQGEVDSTVDERWEGFAERRPQL